MNDWIVANITNPTFTVSDFQNIADMSLDNTQMLKKEDYLKSNFIKENPLFLDKEGNFSENKFNDFYTLKLSSFREFTDNTIPQSMELSIFDTDKTKDSKIKDNEFSLSRIQNPERLKIGIEGVNIWSEPDKSRSEIAQSLKVWDSESKSYKDYSPNDRALFNGLKDYGSGFLSSLFEDPLVLAEWEEDGTHIDPVTHKVVSHKKGDLKLNDEGTYFYETLNGRSPIGKQVLSTLDIITSENSKFNKYDFFDSDDIEKSTKGVIAKNVASILPMFLGGPIGTVYSTALIARELSKSLPMLYNIVTGFSNDEAPEWINTIAAMGDKFTSGTSEYAKNNTFSLENFGNIISDVALQWGLLKTIATAFNKLKGGSLKYMEEAVENASKLYNEKLPIMGALAAADPKDWMNSPLGLACLKKFLPNAEKATKDATLLGRDMSLAYMAIISNSDVFEDAVQHGATRSEAAAIALGSTLGMFAFDRAGFGELFFDEATEDSVKAARAALKKELFGYKKEDGTLVSGLRETFDKIKGSNLDPKSKYLKYIQKASESGKKIISNFYDDMKYHTTNFIEKSLGEGMEEVGEELISDTFKALYELAGKFGFDTASKDIGAWDNMLERYTMSFAGGALGGAVFYGKELWDGKSFKRDLSNDELTTLIRNGHIDDLRAELNKLRDKKKLGSTKLSIELEKDKNGDLVWLTTKDESKSLNEVIYKLINDKITSIDAVLNNNQVNLSDEDLFKLMVLSERRFEKYKEVAPITNYYQDFNNIVSDLIAAELDYKVAANTIDGTVNGKELTDSSMNKLSPELLQTRQENLKILKDKVELLRTKKDSFLSGESSLDYTRKLNFAMDSRLHKLFLTIDEEQLWKDTFGNKTKNDISQEELFLFLTETLPKAYSDNLKIKDNLNKAWERFKNIEKELSPELLNLQEETPTFKSWIEKYSKQPLELIERPDFLNYDSKIEGETEEEYLLRNRLVINPETGELEAENSPEYIQRRNLRINKINSINYAKSLEYADKILNALQEVGYLLDPISMRKLKTEILPKRAREIILDNIRNTDIPVNIKGVLLLLNTDLSNFKELLDKALNLVKSKEINNILNIIKGLLNLEAIVVTNEETGEVEKRTFEEFLYDEYMDEDDPNSLVLDTSLLEVIENIINNQLNSVLTPESAESIIKQIQIVLQYVGEDALIYQLYGDPSIYLTEENVTNSESIEGPMKNILNNISKSAENSIEYLKNNILSIISNILNDPFIKVLDKVQNSVKNPIIELTKKLAGKTIDLKLFPKVEEILQTLEDKFENIDNTSELELDSELMDILIKTRDILKLIDTYLYAASSSSDMNTPIGHNKVFNEFARKHKDLVANWEELPEIDADYALLYNQQINQYLRNINYWINLSNNNTVNKRKQFEQTDKIFAQSLYNILIDRLDTKQFVINIDDKQYDLSEGFNTVDTSLVNTDKVGITVFELEKIVYKNFLKVLKDSGLTLEDFLEKTKLLDLLVNHSRLENSQEFHNSSWNIKDQKVSKLDLSINDKTFTKYDLTQYFSQVLTLNPSEFYLHLKNRIQKDQNTAPITVLEYSSKIAIASLNELFRTLIRYAYKKSKDSKYLACNTTVLPGVAGAGKTSVLCKSIVDYLGENANIIAAGPTSTLSVSLAKALNLKEETTVDNLLKKLLGEDTYKDVLASINKLIYNQNKGLFENFDNPYFTIVENKETGFAEVSLKEDAPIIFKTLDDIPKSIIIDEATHVNTVFVEILDKYMNLVGGQLFLLGDPNLMGYVNSKNAIANITESDIFTIRAPKLGISLRDNNILKQSNLDSVRALIDTLMDKFLNDSEEDLKSYWPILQTLISKIKFNVYNKEDLYGDLITGKLTPELISKINKEGKSIGFIGDQNSSAAFKALKDAGLENKITSLTLETMQGLEFDYVIIDEQFEIPEKDISLKTFLLKLYTLMSRSKQASIFIDNNLTKIIGPNILQDYTAKAPSLNDKINGTSAVEDLRKLKLEILNSYKLDTIEKNEEEKKDEEQSEKDLNNGTNLKDSDFVDVNQSNINSEEKKILEELIKEDESNNETDPEEYTQLGDFDIPSWGDVTYMGVLVGEEEERVSLSTGTTSKSRAWNIDHSGTNPLRNLQALKDDKESAFWYSEKMAWEEELYNVKSALIFDHSWEEKDISRNNLLLLPASIRRNFKKDDWENGTYAVEIRSVDNEVQPLFAPMPEIGFDYNGKRYIANIIYKVKNKDGRLCIFDLAGINDPRTLSANIPTIKDNLKTRINNPKTTDLDKEKFLKAYDSIEASATKYQNLFDSWINEFNTTGKFSMDIPRESINHNNITWFTRRRGKNGQDSLEIRLGGRINPENISETKDFNNLKDRNPGMIFSDIYTYASKDTDIDEIDQSLLGKAVVFVSSDTLLNPDELISRYINQKRYPDKYKPTVRMIVLHNYGLKLSLLVKPKYINTFIDSEAEDRKPFRLNLTGVLMFTSLWNFRASLLNFKDALDTWSSDNHYTLEKVNTIIKSAQYLYKNKPDDASREVYLKGLGISEEDLSNLNKFNLEICKNIPSFRLGFSDLKDKENGFRILSFNIQNSTAYSNGNHNLIVITPEKCNQFLKLILNVLEGIVPNVSNVETLGLNILKIVESTDSEGNKITKKEPFGIKEYLDLKQAAHRRTLSHVLKLENKSLVIKLGNDILAYPEGQLWSMIPNYIAKVLNTVNYLQFNPEDILNSSSSYVYIYTLDEHGVELKTSIKHQIGHLFVESVDGEAPLLKTLKDTIGKDKIGKDKKYPHPDPSLIHLLDLVFHGTIDDIHRHYDKNHPLLIADDAVFKKGFFVNPDISRRKSSAGSRDIDMFEDGNIKFYKIATSDELFTSDVNLRSAGIGTSLDGLEKAWKKYKNPDYEEKVIKAKYKVGDLIEIYTSDGLKQDDAIYRITNLNNTKYGLKYNLENISDKSKLTLDTKDVDLNDTKYKPAKVPLKEIKHNMDNLILTEQYLEIPLEFTDKNTGDKYINPLFTYEGGRNVVIIDIKGFKIPFYCSTGYEEAKSIQVGKWYPVFGAGSDYWLNELHESDINDYYGIPLLKEIAEKLDEKYGDVTGSTNIEITNPTFTEEFLNASSGIEYLNNILNESFTPTENGNSNTETIVKLNILKVKDHINSVFGDSFEIKYPIAYKVIQEINQQLDDKVFTKEDLKDLIEYIKNTRSFSVINLFKQYGQASLNEASSIYYLLDDSDFIEYTLLEYFQTLIPDNAIIDTLKNENGKIIAITNKGNYELDEDTNSFKANKEVEEPLNILLKKIEVNLFNDINFGGVSETSILSTLETIINLKYLDVDKSSDFIKELKTIQKYQGSDFDESLQGIYENPDYDDIIGKLEDNYTNLYNQIFRDCN